MSATRFRVLAFALPVLALIAWCGVRANPSAAADPLALPDMTIIVPTDRISIGLDPGTGRRSLRFTHITADVGAGPFEIVPNYDAATGTATLTQNLYASPSPGTWVLDHAVPVPAIGTWHAPDDYEFPLTSFTLNRISADGSAGAVVATSPKSDYCMTGDVRVPGVANAPATSFISTGNCNDPRNPLGWSTGYGDQYDEFDDGQPIALAGVPDGTYILRATVDPRHVLTESDPTNNVIDTVLNIGVVASVPGQTTNQVSVPSQSRPRSQPPTVKLTKPAANARVRGTVTLAAEPSAVSPATVAGVRFLLDGRPLGPLVSRPPYTRRWTVGDTPAGEHRLSAQVADSNGNLATAPAVTVIVPRVAAIRVRRLVWSHGVLKLRVTGLPRGARLHVGLHVGRRVRNVILRGQEAGIHTTRPRLISLRAFVGGHQRGETVNARLDARPTVQIVNPTAGQELTGVVPIAASASDPVAVGSVQFFVDGRRIGKPRTERPYAIRWNSRTVGRGRHRITARVTNASARRATATIAVQVRNPAKTMACFVLQASVHARGLGDVTAPALRTVAGGETLLAFVSAAGPADARQTATVSGGGLRWRLVRRVNARAGDSEIWTAHAPSGVIDAQITSTLADPRYSQSLTVVAMQGAEGVGASAGASAAWGRPTAHLRTAGGTSLVFAVGNDGHAAPGTAPTGWSALDHWFDADAGLTSWTQYTNQPTGRAGSVVTVSGVAPAGSEWNLAAVELLTDD